MIFKLFLLSTLVGLASSACFDNGDKEIGGSCYKFVAQKLSFEDARNWCHYKNPVTASYLAYVPNQFTSNFLASYARSAFGTNDGSFWIGLSRKSGGSWSWDAGFQLGYTNFGDQVGQNYVAESIVNAKWNTFGASDTNFFVCGYDPAAPPTFAPQTAGPSGPTPTMRATTQPVPTTTGPPCTPSTPRTYFYAYSTDFDFDSLRISFLNLPVWLTDQPIWKTYASVRLDMKNQEEIFYTESLRSFNESLYSHLPDPSLGYQNTTIGSDMLSVIRKFIDNTEHLCGSTIVIAAKRFPNEYEIDDLIRDLQKNHVFVYIISSGTPSGGRMPYTMFRIATQTNGYCIFSLDDGFDDALTDTHRQLAPFPYQLVAGKDQISDKFSQTFSLRVFHGNHGKQEIAFTIVYQSHVMDGTVKSLNYTVTDENGLVSVSSNRLNPNWPACFDFFWAYDAVKYFLKIDYEFQAGIPEPLLVRMNSEDYVPDDWLPINT